MAQQYIDFGTFPNDPTADPIRAAFQKIQDNFTDLYTAQVSAGVLELTAGPGLQQNRTTGNIYLYSLLPNVTIQTANNLTVVPVAAGSPAANTVTIATSDSAFYLNLASTITTNNASLSNLVTAGNLSVTNNVISNLVPNANITYNLGSPTSRWSTFYGNVLSLGSQTVTANSTGILTGNLYITTNITTGNISVTSNISAGNLSTTGTFVATGNITGGNIITGGIVSATGNVSGANITASANLLVNQNANVVGNLVVGGITGITGNVTASANVTVSQKLTTNNFAMTGYVTTDLLPDGDETRSLGSASRKWKDLYLSGNTLTIGSTTLSSNTTSLTISPSLITGNIDAGNVTATYIGGTLTTGTQPNLTSVGILDALSVAGTTTSGNLSVTGNLSTANLTATVLNATTISGNVILPPGANLAAPGSDTQLMFNDGGNSAAVPGLTFNKTTSLLTIQGNVSGGNLTTSGALVASGSATVGSLSTNNGAISAGTGNITGGNISTSGALTAGNATLANVGATSLTATGSVQANGITSIGIVSATGGASMGANLSISSISVTSGTPFNTIQVNFTAPTSATPFPVGTKVVISDVTPSTLNGEYTILTGNIAAVTFTSTQSGSFTGGRIKGGGNTTVNGFMSVEGNISAGNLTTTTVTGQTVSISGNISGANLVASGVLRVDGNANVGNLTTSGLVSAATLEATSAALGAMTGSSLAASGNISAGNLSTTGTLTAGNASFSNISLQTISATGAISGASFSTSGTLNAGAATLGATSADSLALNGAITGATTITSGLVNVTGNMTGGNVLTNGFLSVAGTATVGNIVANNQLTIQSTANIASTLTVGANLALSSISGDGSTVTAAFTQQSTIPFPVGGTVVISGVTGTTAYNGSYSVATASNAQVTFSSSTVGSAIVTSARIRTGGVGLNITANSSLSNMNIAAGAIISALNATANIGTVNSTILSVTGTANAGNLETGGTLSVTGAATTGQLTANGAISANGSLTVNQTANITGALGVGANLAISSITPSSPSAGSATVTFAAQTTAPFLAGSQVNLYNNIPTGYNGTFNVVSGNTTQVVISTSASGATTALGRIRTGGTALNIEGNASVTNLNAASFTTTDAALTNLTFATSGILSLQNGNANIGNITGVTSNLSGNVSGGNLISRGFLQVDGNATMSNVTIANAIVTGTYNVGGAINVGSNIAITNASGTGSVVTLTYATQTSPPFPAGSSIVVTGINPSQYNGTFTVTGSNTTAVTYTSSASGSYVSGGYARTSGTGLILQSTANLLGGLNTSGGGINAGSGAITGGTFSATLFSGNGASITNINSMNAGVVLPITATSGDGATATLTYATASFVPFYVGQSITVAGLVPSGYNGTYTVVTCTTSQVTYASTATGAMTTSGTVTGAARTASSVNTDTVINGAQPNITSVGTLTGLTLNGALTGVNVSTTGYMFASISGGVAAAGTTQGTATALSKQINVVTSATASTATGISLPAGAAGMQVIIINATTVTLSLYPATGAKIDSLATNTAYSLGPNARLMVVSAGTSQWYTMAGIYG